MQLSPTPHHFLMRRLILQRFDATIGKVKQLIFLRRDLPPFDAILRKVIATSIHAMQHRKV
jgi:hypothetical protein